MTHHTRTRADWQQDRQFLIGRLSYYVKDWMGGCPYGQSLLAWSETLDCDVIMLLPCKRWACEHCGVVRAADLSRRIVSAAPNKFITLTVANDRFDSPRHAYDETRRRLPKWSARVRRKIGTFEYVRILEVTKLGYPHYHLLARCPYIPQALLSEYWANLTASPIVDVRKIHKQQNSVNYVCKYLRKQQYCPFTTRRVSWTKQFFPTDDKPAKVSWKLKYKEHRLEHPSTVTYDEWGAVNVYRIGPYAYTNRPLDKQVGAEANEPQPQLVS